MCNGLHRKTHLPEPVHEKKGVEFETTTTRDPIFSIEKGADRNNAKPIDTTKDLRKVNVKNGHDDNGLNAPRVT